MPRLLALPLVLLAMAPCVAARAQVDTREGIALQNQIAELRQELQSLQSQGGGGGGQSPQPYAPQPYGQPGEAPVTGGDTMAALLVRVSGLEEQNRQLQGRIDDLTNQMQHQHDDLVKQIGDLQFKLGGGAGSAPASGGGGEAGGTPEAGLAGPAAAPHASAPEAPAHRTPEMALRAGNAALARHDFAAAAEAAREALAGGHGANAVQAQFLLARAEGGQRDYKAAAGDFYQAYNHAPKSPTAPVALLGVANALLAMGDRQDSCQALAKLQAEFPGASSVKAGVASVRKRAACGH